MYDLWPLIYGVYAICGSVVPLLPQYMDLEKKKIKSGTLSVPVTAIIANELYIIYMIWTGKVEMFHIFHNLLLIYAHFGLIHLTLKTMREGGLTHKEHYFTDFEPEWFLQWTDFSSYVYFILAVFFFSMSVVYYMRSSYTLELLATISIWTESLESLPQVLENFQRGFIRDSVNELTLEMWVGGDLLKAFMNYSSGHHFVAPLVAAVLDGWLLGQQYFEKFKAGQIPIPRPQRRSEATNTRTS